MRQVQRQWVVKGTERIKKDCTTLCVRALGSRQASSDWNGWLWVAPTLDLSRCFSQPLVSPVQFRRAQARNPNAEKKIEKG